MSFALSSLVFVIEEQLEALGDDELALVISQFSRFHNYHLNRRHSGGPKEGCYGCGDPNHFITHCLKKNKHSSNKYDSSKRKDKREYTSDKHKSKGGFDKEEIKTKCTSRRPRPRSTPSLPPSATLTMTPTMTGFLPP